MKMRTVTVVDASTRMGCRSRATGTARRASAIIRRSPITRAAFPDIAYGGIIASLIDCHGAATASAAKLREEGYSLGEKPLPRFVAASLKVDYLKPTPLGTILELRGRVVEIKGRKVTVSVTLSAEGVICAKGEEILVQLLDK